MKRTRQSEKLSKLILLLPSLLLTACNDKTIPVTSITIDQGEVLNVKLRDEVYLSATMLPRDNTIGFYHFVDENNQLPDLFLQTRNEFLTRSPGSFTLKAYPGHRLTPSEVDYANDPYDTIIINVANNEEVEDIFVEGPYHAGTKHFRLYNNEYQWFRFVCPNDGSFFFCIRGESFVCDLFNEKLDTGEIGNSLFSSGITEESLFFDQTLNEGETIYVRITGVTDSIYYDFPVDFWIATPQP